MKKTFLCCLSLLAAVVCRAGGMDSLVNHHIDTIVVKSLRTPLMRTDVPNVVEIITPAEMRRSSAVSVIEAVKLATPLESADLQGLKSSIELRGFTGSSMGYQKYTRVLTDGVPAGTIFGASSSLSGISSIEVLKGPFSALYGSGAMGGVVNVITPQSRGRVSGRADIYYGSYRTMNIGAQAGGSISPKVDFDVTLDYFSRGDDYRTGGHNLLKTTDYEKEVYDPHSYDTLYRNTSMDKTRGTLRLGWDAGARWRLNLYNELCYAGDAPTNGTLWGVYGSSDDRLWRDYHRLDITGTAGIHSIRVSPYVSFEKNDYHDYFSYGDSKRSEEYNTYGILAQDAMALCFGTFVVGADNFSERNNFAASLSDGTPTAPSNPDYLNSQTGVFTQLNFKLLDGSLSGIAGLRYDNILFKTFETANLDVEPDSRNYSTLNPTLSLQYRPWSPLRIHAGAGRAFLAPSAFQVTGEYVTAWGKYRGNPDLKPEISFSWEAGVGYSSVNGALQADLSVFFTDYKNKVVYAPDPQDNTFTTFANMDKSTLQGYEAFFSFDLFRALGKEDYSCRFFASYSRMFHSEHENGSETFPVRYLSRNKATFGADLSWRRFGLNVSGRYAGAKTEDNYVYDMSAWPKAPYVTPTGTVVRPTLYDQAFIKTPDYMVFDASVSYSPGRNITLRVKMANLLDELYMERDGYYMPGRNFSAGVSVLF